MESEYLENARNFLEKLNKIFSLATIDDFFNHLSKSEITKEQKTKIEDNRDKRLYTKKIKCLEKKGNTALIDIYRCRSAYTVLMNEMVIPFLLQEEGMQFSNEYYRIDVIGYKNGLKDDLKDEGDHLKLTPYCWEFGYAVEHENDIGKWIDEAIKLAYIECPYKIIIGYNRPISVQEKENSRFDLNKKCFKYLLKCLNKSNIPKRDNKLIILFGIRSDKGTWDKIQYEGYVVDYGEGKVYALLDKIQELALD